MKFTKMLEVWAIALVTLIPLFTMQTAQAQPLSGCVASLTARDARSRINVRSGPGTQYSSPHYGLVGDEVIILRGKVDGFAIQTDRNGDPWVKVEFPRSRARGWIRRDFVGEFRC